MERRVKGLVLWASISVMSVGCGVEDARIEIQDRRDTENSGPPDLNSDLMEQLDQGAGSYPGDGDGDTGDGDAGDGDAGDGDAGDGDAGDGDAGDGDAGDGDAGDGDAGDGDAGDGASDTYTDGSTEMDRDVSDNSDPYIDQGNGLDADNNYLGEGLDVLTGERKSSCLMINPNDVKSVAIDQGQSSVEYLHRNSMNQNKVDMGLNLDLGGIYQLVTGKVSGTLKILNDYTSNVQGVTAVASYRYETVKKSLYDDKMVLTPEAESLLKSDKEAFRKQCGDQFLSEVTLGGELYLVFSASQQESSEHSLTEVQSALESYLTGLFNVKVGNDVAVENNSVLEDLNIVIQCFNRGGSPQICAETGLESAKISSTDDELRAMIQNSKALLAEDIEAGKVVPLEEEFSRFPVPGELSDLPYWDVFVNPENRSSVIEEWNSLRDSILGQCDSLEYYEVECTEALSEIENRIKNCAEQEQWDYESCESPMEGMYDDILGADMIGSVIIKKKVCYGIKDERLLNFNAQLDPNIPSLVPNMIYNLGEEPFNFDDKAALVTTDLKDGWVIHFFEHPDGAGEKISFEGKSQDLELGMLMYRVSSFILEKK